MLSKQTKKGKVIFGNTGKPEKLGFSDEIIQWLETMTEITYFKEVSTSSKTI